jgi:hypothetical protein
LWFEARAESSEFSGQPYAATGDSISVTSREASVGRQKEWLQFLKDFSRVPLDLPSKGIVKAGRVTWIVSLSAVILVGTPLIVIHPINVLPFHSTARICSSDIQQPRTYPSSFVANRVDQSTL